MTVPSIIDDVKRTELRELTEEEAHMLITLTFIEDFKEPVTPDKIVAILTKGVEDTPVPFVLKVMLGRLEQTDGEYSPAAVMFLASLAKSAGEAVMFAYGLYRYAKKYQKNSVTLEDLTMGPYGMGVPTEEARVRIWDAQKRPGAPLGNYLDTKEAWS